MWFFPMEIYSFRDSKLATDLRGAPLQSFCVRAIIEASSWRNQGRDVYPFPREKEPNPLSLHPSELDPCA